MAPACELCGSAGPFPLLYPAKGVVNCPGCGLIFYSGAAAPGEIYTLDYFKGGEYRDYLADEKALRRNFRHRLRVVRKLKPAGRLLEIGSAYGLFLDEARPYYDVRGIDIAAEPVAHARDRLGLDVRAAEFLDLDEAPGSYDIIALWDTLEHLAHPVRTIRKAGRWLKPGGLLAVTTNDVARLIPRLRKEKWRQMHPPTHLYYFSDKTLSKAVVDAGLEPVHLSHVGNYRSTKSMAYAVFAEGGKGTSWIYSLLTLGGRLDIPLYLNLYDIMLLIARKPADV